MSGRVIVPPERRGGPVSMPADELAAFLSEKPTGAICVTDADGRLVALPARVLHQEADELEVEVDGLDEVTELSAPACVVADRFSFYEAIRGVIAQGSISSSDYPGESKTTVRVMVSRMASFSFANVAK